MDSKQKRQILDQLDCACSSLLINCGQLGCCIADVPEHDFAPDNHDWMTQLSKVAPDSKLRDLVSPGTHDSATYTIAKTKPFSAVGRTQNCNVYEQLQRGARILDIRVAGKGSDKESVYIFHGALAGATFISVLNQVVRFLDENPGEFVFVEVVQEYGKDFSPEQRVYMFDLIQNTVGSKMYAEKDFSKLIDGLSIKEIEESETSCCIILHERALGFDHDGTTYNEESVLEKYGYFTSKKVRISKWNNTRDIDMLFQWNKEEVQRHGNNRKKILNNQLLLTPGVGGANDVLKLLGGQLSLRPVSFATALYKRDVLDNFFRDNADMKWNFVTVDFMDLAPALLSFLISLNFPSKLAVLAAAANPGADKSVDVTDKIQEYIKREKVLYVTNIQEDLGLEFTEGVLTIAYRIGGSDKNCHVVEVDFDESTEIVLGEYSHNEGVLVHVDTESAPAGVVSSGRILSEEEYSSTERGGAAVGYSKDGNETKFKVLS